ncbi:MAG: PIN domain-containing protein [Paludibacter sp.]|jgi:PIN domain nuclease of toxin-antitoxin system|nr:PIN domain-containing protein [Paludibacter sp.]
MKQEIYYIDTNVLVQMLTEHDFTSQVRDILDYNNSIIFVSSECVKEFIALIQFDNIKLRKDVKITSLDIFDFIEKELGYEVRYINRGHIQQLAKLVTFDKHTDPSDRLIIAQAIAEGIPLISSDERFPKYKKYGLDLIYNR